jgi:hypothetical protein
LPNRKERTWETEKEDEKYRFSQINGVFQKCNTNYKRYSTFCGVYLEKIDLKISRGDSTMTKKLLNESTVRRFMKMADLAPLSESFLDEETVNEEEITENEEVVEEAAEAQNEGEEAIEEAADATNEEAEATNEAAAATNEDAEATNEAADAEATNEAADAEATNEVVALAEDEEEEERKDDEIDSLEGDLDMADAEIDLDADGDTDTELSDEGDDLAARAQSILADLADLLTTAGIETTVTDTEDAADDMMDAADDMADAEEDMMDAADDLEEGHKEAPGADMRKGAEKRGAEATLDKGEDHDDAYIKEEENPVDALVAEITSKVISRLNK